MLRAFLAAAALLQALAPAAPALHLLAEHAHDHGPSCPPGEGAALRGGGEDHGVPDCDPAQHATPAAAPAGSPAPAFRPSAGLPVAPASAGPVDPSPARFAPARGPPVA